MGASGEDDTRAQEGYRAKRAWRRDAWKAERGKENPNKVAQQVRRAAALTAELPAHSEKKTAAVCDQPPRLGELAGHIEAPNKGAGGSHPQAAMMPDPWVTNRRPSAIEGQTTTGAPRETNRCATANCVPADKGTFAHSKGFREARSRSATRNEETRCMVVGDSDFYVKATGSDGTQKRQELVNMRPGELRRSLEHWRLRAEEKNNASRKRRKRGSSSQGSLATNKRRVTNMMDGPVGSKVQDNYLLAWTNELRKVAQEEERKLEARETRKMGDEDAHSRSRQIREWPIPGLFSVDAWVNASSRKLQN